MTTMIMSMVIIMITMRRESSNIVVFEIVNVNVIATLNEFAFDALISYSFYWSLFFLCYLLCVCYL